MYQYNAKLRRVVDGDTVDAEIDMGFNIFIKERIRLMGIDTPEKRTRNLFEKSWGLAASARLIELLEENDNNFVIETKIDKKGKFGRVLGDIIINGVNINQQLVTEGLAIPYTGGKKAESREAAGVTQLWEETWYNNTPL
jgi:micrococcal nuclease